MRMTPWELNERRGCQDGRHEIKEVMVAYVRVSEIDKVQCETASAPTAVIQ